MNDQLPQVQVVSTDRQASNPVAPVSPPSPPATKYSPALLFLVVFGILISAGVTAFIWFRPVASKPPPQVIAEASPVPVVRPLFLNLTSPVEGEVVVNSEIVVRGKTLPNVTVAIVTETDEELVESDAAGNFETAITLANGINSFTVTAMAAEGDEKTVTLDIVYDAES